ncbi:MAG TPA: hypothetical protein VMR28_02425 [Candidatus Saccharimonadales bacterium]|nr:hypothetical protein [Candidatus Saccharimonadales bacterium]
MPIRHKRSGTNKKKLLFGLLIIVLVIGAVAIYWHYHNKNLNLAANTSSQTAPKGATSKASQQPTKQSTVTNTTTDKGGVIDQNGQATGSLPPSSQWVSSTSGIITLQQPSPNTTVNSGDTLSGLAKVNDVQFILSDDSVGLIAQGNLTVVNGKFSGILQFTPHSNGGKLEVYYPNPTNGAEEDIIEIDVSFNT